jgi:tRNA (adenine-N(1)-)-methyltransferase non-catalytic subunit
MFSTVSLGKFGNFNSNLIIGRPYYLTFEIQEKATDKSYSDLRVVPASEIHAEDILGDEASPEEAPDDAVAGEEEVIEADSEIKMKSNQHIIDDPSRQALSLEEIEELKKSSVGSGQEIIDKIMSAHANLDEKTAFSLAKYIVRKRKKYLKRFTVLPLDVSMVTNWMVNEKEPARSMEMREETLGLIGCWSNAHCSSIAGDLDDIAGVPQGRWLVVDDTGGLIVASLAERMGILHPLDRDMKATASRGLQSGGNVSENGHVSGGRPATGDKVEQENPDADASAAQPAIGIQRPRLARPDETHQTSTSNVITILHPATQPNISFLSYFGYDPSSSSNSILNASHAHPLHTHLHTVSILQLLHPEHDTAYSTPPPSVAAEELATWKTSKRSTYHRKRRRYDRTRRVVDSTRAGGFDGLVVASATEALGLLDVTVPLLRGGAQVVVYSPHVEPLVELVDAYSSARKGAFMNALSAADETADGADSAKSILANKDDFPVDPRLLLAPNLQTARAVAWQVLPGRSHPMMTSKGGAEGFVFTATRVVPVEGRVEARGRYIKKRKLDTDVAGVSSVQDNDRLGTTEDSMDVDPGDVAQVS